MHANIRPLCALFLIALATPTTDAGAARPSEEGAGNNLSVPVIFSDGVTLSLRGEMLTTTLLGAYTTLDGDDWYHQQDPLNEWQAENLTLEPGVDDALYVDWLDWGDNLESVDWTLRSKVRVEVRLMVDLDEAMSGYEMHLISGSGQDELHGTNGALYDDFQPTVYSHTARLVIQKLTEAADTAELTWDADNSQWTGDALEPLVNSAVWDAGDGPAWFSAEINVSGKAIYGYIWDVRRLNDGEGVYRLTFVLDGDHYPGTANTFFDASSAVVPISEVEVEVEEEEPGSGNTAYLVWEDGLSYIDVDIASATGKGKGGGGGGGRPDGRGR